MNKAQCLTLVNLVILHILRTEGETGIPSVAVKCVEIWKNIGGEGVFWSVSDTEERKLG